MTEEEFKSFKNIIKHELDWTISQKRIEDCKQRVYFAETPEEIQVAVLDILRELRCFEKMLEKDFETYNVKLLTPKERA